MDEICERDFQVASKTHVGLMGVPHSGSGIRRLEIKKNKDKNEEKVTTAKYKAFDYHWAA